MGVNISGKGVLSGLATLVAGVVNNFNLLVTRIIGYTNTGGGGGSSYYTTMVGSTGPGFLMMPDFGDRYAYSADGISWTEGRLPVSKFWNAMQYGNTSFVAISQTLVISSTDGINWTEVSNPIPYSNKLTYGNGKFLISSTNSNESAYSSDGINWTLNTMPVGYYSDFDFGNGKFVAVPQNSNSALYSSDGVTWTASTLPSSGWWDYLTSVNGKFFSFSPNSDFGAYSSDGVTWTAITMPSSGYWTSIAYGNGMFVAIAENSNIGAYSSDGVTWTAITMPGNGNFVNVAYGDGKFVAVASYSSSGAYSSDGINWTLNTMPSSSNWYALIYEDNKFMCISYYNNKAAYSIDGINWTASTMPAVESWKHIRYGTISTLVETQISIGNQGEEGAEILAPVDVYTVPTGKTTQLDKITIKNNSLDTISFDLGFLDPGVELSDQNALLNDINIYAGQTVTYNSILIDGGGMDLSINPGQRIVVFPSAVDVVEVKVYGTETLVPPNDFLGLEYRMMESGAYNVVRMYLNDTQPVPTIGSNITVSGSSYAGYDVTYEVLSINADTEHSSSKSVLLRAPNGSNVGSGTFATGGAWL